MFKEKYTKDNEKISADPAVKKYIKSKLQGEATPKRKIPLNAVIATALSLCLALGVFAVAKTSTPKITANSNGLKTNLTYAEIFDSIKNATKQNFTLLDITQSLLGTTDGSTRNEATEDSAMGTDDNSSSTNNQVEGVDEADRVKNDGRYIYALSNGSVKIVDSNFGKPKKVSEISVVENDEWANEFFVTENRIAVIVSSPKDEGSVKIKIYSTENKEKPIMVNTVSQSGYSINSRMIGNTLYVLSNYWINTKNINENYPGTFVPYVDSKPVSESNISLINNFSHPTYLVITATDIMSATSLASESVLGGAENVYCDKDSLYYTFTKYDEFSSGKNTVSASTTIVKLALSDKDITLVADGKVEGVPLNQFSMDEYEGNLRIVTTTQKTAVYNGLLDDFDASDMARSETVSQTNCLFILDENLKTIGQITDLAPNERVYSVRFDGEIGYFVTFRQVDPLFTVDLADPKNPKVLSQLKIPGFSEYLHPFTDGLLFGFGKSATENGLVTGLKLSMFNVSDPTNVTEQEVKQIDANWSEASNNHKAIMVDSSKNIIAFAANDDFGKAKVYIYGYTKSKGFFEKAQMNIENKWFSGARFMWIGNYFYVVSESEIYSYSLDLFAPTSTLSF